MEPNPKAQISNFTILGKNLKIWVLLQFGQIGVEDPTITHEPFQF
jgi:hypothetical protein